MKFLDDFHEQIKAKKGIKELFRIIVYFFGFFFCINVILFLISYFSKPNNFFLWDVDIPFFWPISVFSLRSTFLLSSFYTEIFNPFNINWFSMATISANIIFFLLVIFKINAIKKAWQIYCIGAISIILSNLIQGLQNGLILPVTGTGAPERLLYFDDAVGVANPLSFISSYNSIQTTLHLHSITHPPGAVLIYYFLNFLQNPVAMSITFMLISLCSVFFIYHLFKEIVNEQLTVYASLIFVFIPAIQIYYLSCVDSVIAFAFLGMIYYYKRILDKKSMINFILLFVFTGISSFLTYLVLIPLAIIFIDIVIIKKYKLLIVISIICIAILAICYLAGFNYILGAATASSFENGLQGSRIFEDPLTFIATRFENIFELIFFFGAVTSVFAYRTLKESSVSQILKKKDNYERLCYIGTIIILMSFIVGIFKTGETARGFLFTYPFLLLFIIKYFKNNHTIEVHWILGTLFVQTLLMQIAGFYFW